MKIVVLTIFRFLQLQTKAKNLHMKIFMFIINTFHWLSIFIIPAGILGFIAYYNYVKSSDNLLWSILLAVLGSVIGIFFAEFIRRKYGLDNFFGRLSATPDIDGGNILDEKQNKKGEETKID